VHQSDVCRVVQQSNYFAQWDIASTYAAAAAAAAAIAVHQCFDVVGCVTSRASDL